ncbi:GTP 3',8-cyclase MoaA [Bacteroidota bacterium]
MCDVKRKYDFEFCLTTNGTLLEDKIFLLKELGLNRLNISIDSLNAEKFKQITGKDIIKSVIHSIDIAEECKFDELKINVVLIKGLNDGEIFDFVDFVRDREITLRFIEYMPFSCNGWDENMFISCEEIKSIIERKYNLKKIDDSKLRVASNFNIEGYQGKIGFISSLSNLFCGSCNRIRIKSDGNMKSCLFSKETEEINLKKYIRDPIYSDSDIARIIFARLQLKEKEHIDITDIIKLDKNKMIDVGG